ncbi:MAG TPA: methyl-accepting chemotaxis protein [Rhodocyclaceae bacterium]|nr:methyl-accepting chemotaxis protein [Rhodocyclaceae bacterium]
MSFRFIILASLGAPALLLWITGYYSWHSWATHQMLQNTIAANRMGDQIIVAAGQQAIERGFTAGLLSADGAANDAARQRLAALREKGDTALREAFAIAREIESTGRAYTGFSMARAAAEASFEKVAEARRQVDRSIGGAARTITAPQWIPLMSDFIAQTARMRLQVFADNTMPPDITYPNLTTKHHSWLASEYAGQERAVVTAMINGNRPAPAETLQRLMAFRQTVDANIANLLFMRDIPGMPASVVAAIDEMEANFLGSFEQTRKKVYAEASSYRGAGEDRHYSISANEWFEQATAAINSILRVSEAFSAVGNDNAQAAADIAFVQMIGYMFVFAFMVLMTAVATLLLLGKLRALARLQSSMREVASGQGDLTRRLDADTTDEIGQTSAAFNEFADKLQRLIGETRTVVHDLAQTAAKVMANSRRVGDGSRVQSEMSSSTAAAVEQMTVSIDQVAEHARETLDDSKQSGELAEAGTGIVRRVADEMQALAAAVSDSSQRVEGLGQRSREISGIVEAIREIAEQTNLLALNAAIEAARAGEQGRGFAVVADEVRKLAERTSVATVDISRMIETIQSDTGAAVDGMRASTGRVEQGVSLTREAAAALDDISRSAQHTLVRVGEIANATREQSAASGDISRNVEQIARMAEKNDGAIAETTNEAQHLEELAGRLNALVGRFRV